MTENLEPAPTFARASEAEAYRVLHAEGVAALERAHGTVLAYDLINRWARRHMLRVSHSAGGFTVKTFKKYAQAR